MIAADHVVTSATENKVFASPSVESIVPGGTNQHVVIETTGEKIPFRPRPDRVAEILKTDEVCHSDPLIRKELVIAVLPNQHIDVAPADHNIVATEGDESIAEGAPIYQVIIPAAVEYVWPIPGFPWILNHVTQIVKADLKAFFERIDVQRLEITADVSRGKGELRRNGRGINQPNAELAALEILIHSQHGTGADDVNFQVSPL